MESGWQKIQVSKGQKHFSYGENAIALSDYDEKNYPLEKNFFHVFIKNPTWKTRFQIDYYIRGFRVIFSKPASSDEDYFFMKILDIEGHTRFVEIRV